MSIAGHLNFLTRALNFGCPFIRRLYDAVGPWMMKKRRHLKIHEGIKQDMEMWKDFLSTKPYCKSFIEYLELPGEEVNWMTDASGAAQLGFGCYLNGYWIAERWPEDVIKPDNCTSTCFLELLALVCSVEKWVHLFRNKRVKIHCDNQAVVAVFNNCTSRCSKCMFLIRMMVGTCMKENFRAQAMFIRTEDNVLADSLSRLQLQKIFQLNPAARGKQVKPPPSLWPMPWSLRFQ